MGSALAVRQPIDRPILMRGPLVVKTLADLKWQTRRLIKPQPIGPVQKLTASSGVSFLHDWDGASGVELRCPYGQPGDRLWVRETWCLARPGTWDAPKSIDPETGDAAYFAAGWERSPPSRWRPSIHMPRWASRLTLEITEVRVERLQDISEEDASAEGVEPASTGQRVYPGTGAAFVQSYRAGFEKIWGEINGTASWSANPWVWVVGFKRVEAGR